MRHVHTRGPAHPLALALALALGPMSSAQALSGTSAAKPSTSGTPTFPVPASAKVQPAAGASAAGASPAGAQANPGGLGAPAAATPTVTAATPTTTYVPSGGTPLPSTAPSATTTTPSATRTTTAATTTTPTVPSSPGITSGQAASPAGARATSRAGDHPLSTGAIVIAALGALLALACAAWGLARRRAFEPHWWLSLRHAMAEAGFRTSATWAEFADWVRLGH